MTKTFHAEEVPVLFFLRPDRFSQGLAKGYCSFLLINDCPCGFAETRHRVGRSVRYLDLGVQKRLATYFQE